MPAAASARNPTASAPAVTMSLRIAASRIVTPTGTLNGWVEAVDGTITAIDTGPAPDGVVRLADGLSLVPGFVDIHVHGGGGHSMTSGDPDDVVAAALFHQGHGTTTTLVSFVTAPIDDLVDASRRVAALIDSGSAAAAGLHLAGIHLEGPFLSTGRCGAQNPAHMVDPTPDRVDALIEAGSGHLRVVTIAPERPGALDAVARFVAAGVVVAIGHTDAGTAEATAAIAAGATLATHLGNAMPPLHHREPGPIGACLNAPEVACELIVDGHHLHPAMISLTRRAKGGAGVALITDAISAAGAPDGRYVLGELDVDVVNGEARLLGEGSLAGSTLTMDAALRNAVNAGLGLSDAVAAASTNPSRVIGGSAAFGSISVGQRADLVVLAPDLTVRAVVAGGAVVTGALVP